MFTASLGLVADRLIINSLPGCLTRWDKIFTICPAICPVLTPGGDLPGGIEPTKEGKTALKFIAARLFVSIQSDRILI